MFSCSSGDSDDESADGDDEKISQSNDDDDDDDDDDDEDEDEDEDDEEDEEDSMAELDGSEEISDDDESSEEMAIEDGDSGNDVNVETGNMKTMTVSSGDTYMLLAFKIYGDYRKWRSIASLNQGKSNLSPGMNIKYYAPSRPFSWSPRGNPYLIRRGETLGTISSKVYGDMGKWRAIWKNNRPMIRNPNLIFAGFTLYYLDRSEVVAML